MADYVKALKNFRRQLASNPRQEPEAEAPSPSSGFMSNTRRQLQSQQPVQDQQVEYEPSSYVSSGLQRIIGQREEFQRASERRAEEASSKSAVEAAVEGAAQGKLKAEQSAARQSKFRQSIEEVANEKKANSSEGGQGGGMFSRRPRGGSGGDEKFYAASNVVDDGEFISKVKNLAGKFGVAPEELMSVMHFETGGSFSPSQRNAAGSSATGLIQFLSSTAKDLGTSTEALSNMSRLEQLDYVDSYLSRSPIGGRGQSSGEDLYMSIFYPAAVGKGPDHVLFSEGSKAYAQNSGLDSDGKGYITVADASRKALRYTSAYRGI